MERRGLVESGKPKGECAERTKNMNNVPELERKTIEEIKRISAVFIRRGSVFTVHCLIFGVKQKFLRNFAKTLDNIYISINEQIQELTKAVRQR